MGNKNPLDELFINANSTTVYLVNSDVWKKLLFILEQHKSHIEELQAKVKLLEVMK